MITCNNKLYSSRDCTVRSHLKGPEYMTRAQKTAVKNDKLVTIGVRISESTKLKFDDHCKQRGIKLGWQVEEMIKEFLEKNKPSYREEFVNKESLRS